MRVEFERRVLRLFDGLLDQPEGDRARWLNTHTGGDAELIRSVMALVTADERSAVLPTMVPAGDASAAEEETAPDQLGHWRIVREIGRGGMGIVYLAERSDGLFDQRVALKLIRSHVAARGAPAFEAERRLLARVEHPGVARLIDGGVAPDGRPWLATEHVEGVTIDRAVEGLSPADRLRLVRQVAMAVQYAHGRLIAHGDIKPANILVDAEGRARLLDFGVARLLGAAGSDSAAAFTPGFASAERVVSGMPTVADDVFALGRTLAALTESPGSEAGADRELAAIIGRATAPDGARYPSVEALIGDLDRRLDGRPVAAVGGGALYRARKFVQRHAVGVVAAVAAVIGLSATALVAQRNYRRAEQARTVEAMRFADAHRTAHYLMFDLLDRLERRPGTLRLRMQVAGVAQHYLDRLANSPGASREVRLDVAKGYLRAAGTAGMSSSPNFGDVDLARHDVDQARRMLLTLRRDEPQWNELAEPIAKVGSLACQNNIYGTHDVARALREADAWIAQVEAIPADPATRAAAAWRVRLCAADALVWLNRTGEAIAMLTHDAAAARRRLPIDMVLLERNQRILGEAYYYARRFPDAERVLLEAAAIQAAAQARAPFSGQAAIEATNVADDLASTYAEQHRYRDQLRVAQGALAAVKAQAALDPDDMQSFRRVLSIDRLVADALSRTGRPAAGVALMQEADRGWEKLAARSPNDSTTWRLRLLGLLVMGTLQDRTGDRAAACATYRQTRDGWTAFAARWRLSPSDRDESVVPLTRKLAGCQGGDGGGA